MRGAWRRFIQWMQDRRGTKVSRRTLKALQRQGTIQGWTDGPRWPLKSEKTKRSGGA